MIINSISFKSIKPNLSLFCFALIDYSSQVILFKINLNKLVFTICSIKNLMMAFGYDLFFIFYDTPKISPAYFTKYYKSLS